MEKNKSESLFGIRSLELENRKLKSNAVCVDYVLGTR
jgi:hypothetical protein